MAQPNEMAPDMQYLLSDLNTRIRDAEERNKVTKDKVFLFGKNLIDAKEELAEDINELKRENLELKAEIEKIKRMVDSLVEDSSRFVKKEEILLVERMLKDFQPLEFVRMSDLENIIDERMKKK